MGAEDKIIEILERVVSIETKIDGYNNLREKLDKTYGLARQNQKDVSEIKDNTKWLWRTIAGAILVGILGAIIKFR
jgi:hypothetical protein